MRGGAGEGAIPSLMCESSAAACDPVDERDRTRVPGEGSLALALLLVYWITDPAWR